MACAESQMYKKTKSQGYLKGHTHHGCCQHQSEKDKDRERNRERERETFSLLESHQNCERQQAVLTGYENQAI